MVKKTTTRNTVASYWMWQEHGGKPIRVNIGSAMTADQALARHFKQHEQLREESPKDKRALRDFLPEVTPGILRLYVGKVVAWSSEPTDLKFGETGYSDDKVVIDDLAKSLREAIQAVFYHSNRDPLSKGNPPRTEWLVDAQRLLKRLGR